MGDAAIITQAISSLGQGIFGWITKTEDRKIIQEGSNTEFQQNIISAELEKEKLQQQQTNLIVGIIALIVVVTIVAVVIITLKKKK